MLSEVAHCCSLLLLFLCCWVGSCGDGAMVLMRCGRRGGGGQLFSEDAKGGGFSRWSRGDGKMLFRRLLLTVCARFCSYAVG